MRMLMGSATNPRVNRDGNTVLPRDESLPKTMTCNGGRSIEGIHVRPGEWGFVVYRAVFKRDRVEMTELFTCPTEQQAEQMAADLATREHEENRIAYEARRKREARQHYVRRMDECKLKPAGDGGKKDQPKRATGRRRAG